MMTSPQTSATTGGSPAIDIDVAVGTARIGPYHVGLAVLVGLVVFFEGYDTFNAAYVIHYVMGPWGLRSAQAGLLVSSGIVGFSLAALFQGKISDAFGRRVAILGALWMATIFSLATALWAHSFWTFCLWRFLTGLGLGVLLPSALHTSTSSRPARRRLASARGAGALGSPPEASPRPPSASS